MAVYATNQNKTVQGIVKPSSGADYLIPPEATDFVISGINVGDVVYKSAFVTISGEPTKFIDRAGPGEPPSYAFRFQGYIQFSTDFPTKRGLSKGDTYKISNPGGVIDNSINKTNTGQAFNFDDQIYWNGNDWSLDGAGGGSGPATNGSWQKPVISRVIEPLGGEVIGARYLVAPLAVNAFSGKGNQLAELTPTGWVFTPPLPNVSVVTEDTDSVWTYDADMSSWVDIASPGLIDSVGQGIYKSLPRKVAVDLDPTGGLVFTDGTDTAKLGVGSIDGGTF